MLFHLLSGIHNDAIMLGVVLAGLEIAFIVLIVTIVLGADWRKWRRRWLEAREVAERMRLAETFWTMGVWPHALSVAQPAWTGWYVRSVLREQPVFHGDLSRSMPDIKRQLAWLIADQMFYHAKTEQEMKEI